MKKALITGITGQDGSYLAELLLEKGYEVHGVIRRSSSINTKRIDGIFSPDSKAHIHYAQLGVGFPLLLNEIRPDEIYNLGAMSHVRVSFDVPIYTAEVTGLGPLRLLEDIRAVGLDKTVKYYQASSSEMFGLTPPPQNENSLFNPVSPYGCSKLFAYNIVRSYRLGYNMFASNGILFNHESPRRGETFVTRKITIAAARIKWGLQKELRLGNLDAKRDWGHSRDYVKAMWMILQQDTPDDFVIATENQYTVKEFLVKVFEYLDLDPWKYVIHDDSYRRPVEVPSLLGDATKAKNVLGWEPETSFEQLVKEMVDNDLLEAKKEFNNRSL